MKINISQLGKRYNREWIFRHFDYTFHAGEAYAILGSNGSGKSTLLQVIAGNQMASEGSIQYFYNEKSIAVEKIFQHLSLATPYLELVEEYTLIEAIEFHKQFKAFVNELSSKEIIEICELEKARDKEIKYFSSGMKQRVRLVLAILSNTPLLLLDEPTSNLDKKGQNWYAQLMQNYSANRIVLVCSNHQMQEYDFCSKLIEIEDYKLAKA